MVGYRRLAVVVCLIVTALLSIAACQQGKEMPKYRIALGPWVGFGPLYLARDKGFFKEQGVEVDLIVLTGVAERNSALKSGKLDALAAPVDYFALSAGNGVPATIVMAIDESVGGDGIVARRSIKSIGDLRKKKVAAQKGLPSDFFLRALAFRRPEFDFIVLAHTAFKPPFSLTATVSAACSAVNRAVFVENLPRSVASWALPRPESSIASAQRER